MHFTNDKQQIQQQQQRSIDMEKRGEGVKNDNKFILSFSSNHQTTIISKEGNKTEFDNMIISGERYSTTIQLDKLIANSNFCINNFVNNHRIDEKDEQRKCYDDPSVLADDNEPSQAKSLIKNQNTKEAEFASIRKREAELSLALRNCFEKNISEGNHANEQYELLFEPFNLLIDDMKRHIFSFLGLRDISICRSVSKSWRSLFESHLFSSSLLRIEVKQLSQRCRQISRITLLLKERNSVRVSRFDAESDLGQKRSATETYEARESYLNKSRRLEYLNTTVKITEALLSRTFNPEDSPFIFGQGRQNNMVNCFKVLLGVLRDHLSSIRTALEKIALGTMNITVNFDIFELSLRRYFDQLKCMFINSNPKLREFPSLLIRDLNARRLWEDKFGSECYYCDFDRFCSEIIDELVDESDPDYNDLKRTIKFFVNFPQDNIVTTYKWNLLLCHFGPLKSIIPNLKRYALCNGFLGSMNAIRAREVLREYKGHILMRFSRLEPTKLTVSHSNERGKVTHSRKPVDVSLNRFITQTLGIKNPRFAPKHLDFLTIAKKTVMEYASLPRPHY